MKRAKNEQTDVDAFYDSISKSYTGSIQRCVPQYYKMLISLFIYLKPEFSPKTVLELGCGTGNLTLLIHQRFPEANITAVDISSECINECKLRIPNADIHYIKSDFKDIDFLDNTFDLIISSISIHHLNDKEKEILFNKLYCYQTKGGILSFCDQFRGETDFIYQKHIERWKEFAVEQGTSNDEWEMWMQHQHEHDYHSSLLDHLVWIGNAGYNIIDCTRRYLLWTTIYAEK